MRHPTLVVLAAGRSEVFAGRRQQTSVGPDGERLCDYTVYDALSCGFGRVVFVVRPDNEKEVRQEFEDRFGPSVLVSFVSQYRPLGTGHAVASLGGLVPGPFALVNASDWYGREAVRLLGDKLRQYEADGPGAKTRACMVSFRLGDTLSDSAGVSRAVFRPEAEGSPVVEEEVTDSRTRSFLRRKPDPDPDPEPAPRVVPAGFDEILDIRRSEDGGIAGHHPDGAQALLTPDALVSMNLWGFDLGIVEALNTGYNQWTYDLEPGQVGEYRLSSGMDHLLRDDLVDLEMLAGPDDTWMGLFHRTDVAPVQKALAAAIERGEYPPSLKKAMRG